MSIRNRKITASDKETFRWLLKHTDGSKYLLLLLALENAVNSSLGIADALIIRNVVDYAVARNAEGFLHSFLLYGTIFLISLMLNAMTYWQSEKISFKLERTLKNHLYQKLLHTEYSELGKWQTGELMNFLGSDVDIITGGIMQLTQNLLAMLVKMVGAFSILFLWDWRFAVFFVACGLCFLMFSAGFRKISKRLHRNVRMAYDQVWNFLQETLGNILIIRSFRAETRAARILDDRMDQVWCTRSERNCFSNLCYSGFYAAMDIGYLLGLLWCGWGILHGTITYGTLVAVLQLVGQVQSPFEGLSSMFSRYSAMCSSAERLQHLGTLPEERAAENDFDVETILANYERLAEIRIENLSFSYDAASIFQHADLRIRKGEIIGFTGLSGIGKTTLLKLLLGVYTPNGGTIRLHFSDDSFLECGAETRPFFSYVPQGNCLLSGTIADAVSFLHTDNGYTDEERYRILDACRLACADTFISELPNGYETMIGERGAGLSEGQLQRLAIARAIYSGAPILLLDEATSALDETTERQVLLHLKNFTDRTVLIVTHRQAALSICSKIVEIREGKILELFFSEQH